MLKIHNKDARRLWLAANLLDAAPTGPLDVMAIIRGLGFVQLDTIQIVARAHHHILWSRNQNYREHMFDPLLAKERAVFEHFTHDASVLPMETLPFWQRQFQRKREQIERNSWYKNMSGEQTRAQIKARIADEGALSTQAFDTKRRDPSVAWSRPPHKMALDYMWHAGELATCYRENFTKYYNLAERVFPEHLRAQNLADEDQIDWLCNAAMDRLGFATANEISKFWDAVSIKEVRAWLADQTHLVPVSIQCSDGSWRDCIATADIRERLDNTPSPTGRLRILNPFDPAIRDRDRLKRLFGMDYKIEIFVPEAKRKYGYYVYPLLEGSRFVGRAEVTANRKTGALSVGRVWPEDRVKWTDTRQRKLAAEADRLARFVGCSLG